MPGIWRQTMAFLTNCVLTVHRLVGPAPIASQDLCWELTIQHGHLMDIMYVTVIFLSKSTKIENLR